MSSSSIFADDITDPFASSDDGEHIDGDQIEVY